jgi:hypothetical protein
MSNQKTEKLYLWFALLGLLFVFAGLLMMRALPPPSPTESAGRIAAVYRDHASAIRWGGILAMFGVAWLGPWYGVLTKQLKRIEGPNSPSAYCQLALGALLILETIFPLMILETAVFRPNRSPSEILVLSDLCWIPFVGLLYTLIVEWIVTGIAILRDNREQPIFPRWVGQLNFLAAALSLPGLVVVVAKTGPFAWNGVLGFWVPTVVGGLWIVTMTVFMFQAVNEEQAGLGASATRYDTVEVWSGSSPT